MTDIPRLFPGQFYFEWNGKRDVGHPPDNTAIILAQCLENGDVYLRDGTVVKKKRRVRRRVVEFPKRDV